MMQLRRAGERYRGGDPQAGIETRHAFSFGPHYDPDNLRFGPLIACNEERLEPGAGFEEHPHRDVEIVTWVVEGELTHRDSAGHASVVRPGDVQRLSAGSGVRHTERNEGEEPLRFVQMWLEPARPGGEPSYEIVRGIAAGTPYALANAGAVLHIVRLAEGERAALPMGDAGSGTEARTHLQVVRGRVRLPDHLLGPGDELRISGQHAPELTAATPAELLIWEM
ncbi:pirin family protein [Streptomyces sp. NPDC001922]|uniref:pirin family protein n=1 Tax=Streptomyces sp. NPDC001922 TaxID=3364624 RepID=UPI0036BEB7CA